MEELDAFRQGIIELQEVVNEARTELHRLVEKSDVNREFLSKLSDVGKHTSHFAGRRNQGTVAEMERSERKLFMELTVLVANNRATVDRVAKNIRERLPKMEAELEELKAEYNREQGEHNFFARFIPEQQVDAEENVPGQQVNAEENVSEQQVNAEQDGPREDLPREDWESREVDNPDDAGDIL
ncbi:unnamed protein product [Clonostachys chloroleuca]|uniref:Uncharacterized protein n=1 Tax=Clonostachys chloroleuca TaxID=1926264 RepID=A0AA35LU28_9HYPO|nr:unnamed protein product [Clonostachys chloroleuca]